MISTEIAQHFINKGYEVYNQSLVSGGHEISVTKGGFFKAVFGLKTALKIKLLPDENGMINFRAGVGVFGQQVVPTILTLFVAWPVLFTQIWGLVQQSKLDDQALMIAEDVISKNGETNFTTHRTIYCTKDGARIPADSRFCPYCGTAV